MAKPTSAATASKCASEREDKRTYSEETMDGEDDIPGAFFSTVTRTAFCRMDSDLVPCVLALHRVDEEGVEGSLEEEGPELEILEAGDMGATSGAASLGDLVLDEAGQIGVSCMRACFLASESFWKGRRRFSFLHLSARVSFSNSQSSGLSHPISWHSASDSLKAFSAVKLHTSSPSSCDEIETRETFLDGGEGWTGEATAASLAPKVGGQVRLEPYSLNTGSLEETDLGVVSTGEAGQAAGALAKTSTAGCFPLGKLILRLVSLVLCAMVF
jgi:hypothetical protein